MSANAAEQQKYGFSRTVEMNFDAAREKTIEALKTEGFGVLSEIRLDEKLKEKIGVDFRRYVILGACNPSLAFKTLQEEINIGLLLPCNVIVYEAEEKNKSIVAAVDAAAMLSVVGENPALSAVSTEVNERLRRAIEKV